MSDAELDARVEAMPDEDVEALLDGTDSFKSRLMWFRPRATLERLAREILERRRKEAAG